MQETNINHGRKKGIMLFVVVAMSFMATLDSSIVNVALPVMSKKMNVPVSSIEWVVASYSIIICSTLLFFGRLGDIVGKTKVFQGGTVLFTAASLICGLCHSFLPLIICRFIQGIGASAYMANNNGIITELYPKDGRGKALGILAAAVALGTMIGPPAGGFIVSFLNWNFIFWINVPIGIIVFLLGLKYLPKGARNDEQIDKSGAALQFFGTILLFGALIQAQKTGFENLYILSTIFLALVLIALFVKLERSQRQPLLDLSILKNRLFSLSLVCALISFLCIQASNILLPFYLQDTLKLTPSQAGLFMMLSPLIVAVFSPVCGTISDRMGSESITLIGLLFMGAGFFLMSGLRERSPIALCALFVSIMAIGQSLFQPANNSLIMSACPKNKLGIAGSVNSLVRNLGQSVGLILSTTFLYYFMGWALGRHVSDYVVGRDDVFIFGMKYVYIMLMIICCVGAALTAYRLWGARDKSRSEKAVDSRFPR